MKKEFIKTRDEYNLDVHIFEVENPRAVIQVIHGMEEHQERYEDIIKVLNKKGFLVVSSDMRGHGKSCKKYLDGTRNQTREESAPGSARTGVH